MSTKAPAAAAAKPTEIPAADRPGVGEITNLQDGRGTVQLEPKPEDFPASARMTPPSIQVNTSRAQSVGTPDVAKQSEHDPASDAIAEGQAAQGERIEEGVKVAGEIADLKRQIDDKKAA